MSDKPIGVEVKCVGCGKKRWIGPDEVVKGDLPECECFNVMVPTGRARAGRASK